MLSSNHRKHPSLQLIREHDKQCPQNFTQLLSTALHACLTLCLPFRCAGSSTIYNYLVKAGTLIACISIATRCVRKSEYRTSLPLMMCGSFPMANWQQAFLNFNKVHRVSLWMTCTDISQPEPRSDLGRRQRQCPYRAGWIE